MKYYVKVKFDSDSEEVIEVEAKNKDQARIIAAITIDERSSSWSYYDSSSSYDYIDKVYTENEFNKIKIQR